MANAQPQYVAKCRECEWASADKPVALDASLLGQEHHQRTGHTVAVQPTKKDQDGNNK